MWTGNRSRVDRILAAIEIPALGLWIGALCGFAFIFAPIAFRIVAPLDVGRFAALTSAILASLAIMGYCCGGLAIVMALWRSRDAGDAVRHLSPIHAAKASHQPPQSLQLSGH